MIVNNELEKYTFAIIANLTHQAINPLNGVIGTLENIIEGVTNKDKQEQRLISAKSQLIYTVSLIRNLAFFAEYGLDNNEKITRKNNNNISIIPQTLIEAVQFFQEQAKNKGVKLNIENRTVANAVYGSPDLLRQVFMNIFDNYVKYSDNDERVTVTHHIQKRTNDVLIQFEGRSVVGFDDSENIFNFGTRGRLAVQKTSSGSGLGLHICRIILEKVFNGTISGNFNSQKKLVTFLIRIPNGFLKEDHYSNN